MTSDRLKLEFEIRKLKKRNEELNKMTSNLSMKLKTTENKLNARIIQETNNIENKYKKENKELKRIVKIKEDLEIRYIKKLDKKDEIISDNKVQIKALQQKLLELAKELDLTKEELKKYEANLNLDGTTAGIPTSQTPINKTKLIPNTRKKSGNPKGGQFGHKKHKLESFKDEEINEKEEVKLEKCPHCHSKDLKELDTSVTKDELDYEIKIIKKRYYFKEYECNNCHNKVRENIPNKLKEENQYGSKVQAHVLSLTNIANVPFNKTRRIISGLSSNEINLSEGYIAKLQKRGSNLLENFIKDLNDYITSLNVVHWDDTVIFVNTKRSCLRFYGDNDIALYTAHETKGKQGLDEDNLLNRFSKETKVVHDHNKVNYNDDYVYINVECCQHLERDLEKVKLNIPESTWSVSLKELFASYNHKRNEYIKNNIDSFSFEETNDFMIKFDECILLGVEENKKHGKSHYFKNEKTLLARLIEYRDNYTYWLYDFSLPYTNNTSERGLRGIKTKMKVSGQFQNIEYAKYYANIKSYIETCHRNGINEVDALIRLIDGNPFGIDEIVKNSKNKEE